LANVSYEVIRDFHASLSPFRLGSVYPKTVQPRCRPFFFKQWGGTRKKVAGRLLDGKSHNGFPVHGLGRSVSLRGKAILPDLLTAFVPVQALASK
jgi:hypothetical protein